MLERSEFQVGIAAIAVAVFLLVVGIPYGISTPSNIRHIVLSPTFWPRIIAALMVLLGLGLLFAASRGAADEEVEPSLLEAPGGLSRLAGMAVLMAAYFLLIPVLGLVWASMLAFGGTAALVHTRHPVAAAASAVIVPLLLYAFFAHVAGVSVPQGEIVRLP